MLQLYFIWIIARESILEMLGHADSKMRKEESGAACQHVGGAGVGVLGVGGREGEGERALWLLFLCFSLPMGLPYANWA